MTDIEDWVKEATEDDSIVAELLLGFKQFNKPPETEPAAPLTSSTPAAAMTSKPALSIEWKVRQRRSKAVMVQCNNNKQQQQEAPRASPTTPLISWSGGATSVSGGAGGGGMAFDGGPEEECSRPSPAPPVPISKLSDKPRSNKVIALSETFTKRSRKKKTLTELKEEEDLLEKERRKLKRELASLCNNLEKARATNENLKRIKLELQPPESVSIVFSSSPRLAVSDQLQQKIASFDPIPAILPTIVGGSLQCSPPNGFSKLDKEVGTGKFVLPDLNLPLEEI